MRRIFSNLGLKIAALFLALLLWFHATTDRTFIYDFALPMTISGLSPDLVLANQLPGDIKVKVKGKGKQLIKYFLSHKESVAIDISKFRGKEINYVIRPEDIPLPKDLSLEVAEVDSPKEMKIYLDYFLQKEVPVKSQIVVIPQSGYVQVDSLKLEPDRILVSGPKTLVEKIAWIETEKRILDGSNSSVSGRVSVVMPEGFGLKMSAQRVEYSARIEKLAQREFLQMVVAMTNLSSKRKARIQPERVNLMLEGVSEQIEGLSPDKIKVSLDFSRVGKARGGKLAVQVELPQGIELIKIEPDSVKFTLQ